MAWSGLTTRGAVAGGLAGLLCAVVHGAAQPRRVDGDLQAGPAPFPYDNPALFSVPLAFAMAWAVSVLDRSEAASRVRAAFTAQHVRAQTGARQFSNHLKETSGQANDP